ncbi:MAG: porin [Hydrogenophaga sp.]|jgi:predicted porin|nr:porin [Hydrogenophaga sp.]
MKKYLVPTVAILASYAALAQSNATISGGVVIGLKHASAKANGTPSRNSLENLDAGGSHITFRALEDLGSGLKASALLNYRFNPTDGSTGAGHDHFANTRLSLSGSFGAVSMGRFWGPVDSLLRPSLDVYIPLGLGTSVFGGPLDASTRYNGMLMYETPEIKGFVAGLAFVPKASMASKKVNTTELALRYKAGPLALGLGITKNAGAGPSAKDNLEGKDVLTVGGAYDFGVARAGLTYSHVDAYGTTAESDRWSAAVRVPLSGVARLKLGYENQKFKGGARTSAVALGGEYSLSKRTMLFAETGKVSSDTPSRDETGLTYIAGIKHSF